MTNKFLWGGVAVAILLAGFAYFSIPAVSNSVNQNFGAVSGPDSFFPCESHNGVTRCFNRSAMKTATTTVCSFRSPNATSTLMIGSAVFRTASSSASIVTLAKSSSPSASTTLLASAAIGASAQGSIMVLATSTNVTLDNGTVFVPNTYFNVSIQAGDIGGMTGLAAVGSCDATFEVL